MTTTVYKTVKYRVLGVFFKLSAGHHATVETDLFPKICFESNVYNYFVSHRQSFKYIIVCEPQVKVMFNVVQVTYHGDCVNVNVCINWN